MSFSKALILKLALIFICTLALSLSSVQASSLAAVPVGIVAGLGARLALPKEVDFSFDASPFPFSFFEQNPSLLISLIILAEIFLIHYFNNHADAILSKIGMMLVRCIVLAFAPYNAFHSRLLKSKLFSKWHTFIHKIGNSLSIVYVANEFWTGMKDDVAWLDTTTTMSSISYWNALVCHATFLVGLYTLGDFLASQFYGQVFDSNRHLRKLVAMSRARVKDESMDLQDRREYLSELAKLSSLIGIYGHEYEKHAQPVKPFRNRDRLNRIHEAHSNAFSDRYKQAYNRLGKILKQAV